MAQITSGIRAILSHPAVYSLFQNILGAPRARKEISGRYIRAESGDVLIDVGCGPGDMLDYLSPHVVYHGFDLSPAYIEQASAKYGARGRFHCADVGSMLDERMPPCRLAIAIGLLHHLNDGQVATLLGNVRNRLVAGGRLVTVDPAYWESQSCMARWLISKDRGQEVRRGPEYARLAGQVFDQVVLHRRDDLLNIPYTHAILECRR